MMKVHELSIPRLVVRRQFVASLCAGRSVIDIGWAAHPEGQLHRKKHQLLHDQLIVDADKYTGVDLVSAIDLRHARGNYFTGDATQPGCEPFDTADVVVLCETLEHVDNPYGLLANCQRWCGRGGTLIVSVPNALGITLHDNARKGVEIVHPDHVAWYSPATLTSLLRRNGFVVTQLLAYGPSATEAAKRAWGHPNYVMAPGLIAICKREDQEDD